MRVTKCVYMCVCVCLSVSVCVVSESEIFSRRHATSQHDRGFIDWGCDGGGKNSCRLEGLNKITYTDHPPQTYTASQIHLA